MWKINGYYIKSWDVANVVLESDKGKYAVAEYNLRSQDITEIAVRCVFDDDYKYLRPGDAKYLKLAGKIKAAMQATPAPDRFEMHGLAAALEEEGLPSEMARAVRDYIHTLQDRLGIQRLF